MKIESMPARPRQEEVDTHNCTHIPFRSWCPVCIEAKGKENPHRRTKGGREGKRWGISIKLGAYGESMDVYKKIMQHNWQIVAKIHKTSKHKLMISTVFSVAK